MVRLRKQDGSVQVIDKLESIEILDTEGALGMVIFTDRRNVINALIPGDPVFNGYCRAHRLGCASVHTHESPAVQRALSP